MVKRGKYERDVARLGKHLFSLAKTAATVCPKIIARSAIITNISYNYNLYHPIEQGIWGAL